MRLPLFVLRQLKPFSPSVLLLERAHPEFRKEQISSLQLLLRWEEFVWYSILPLNL
jgi:hypothetical protein